jgi:hypothetical protein
MGDPRPLNACIGQNKGSGRQIHTGPSGLKKTEKRRREGQKLIRTGPKNPNPISPSPTSWQNGWGGGEERFRDQDHQVLPRPHEGRTAIEMVGSLRDAIARSIPPFAGRIKHPNPPHVHPPPTASRKRLRELRGEDFSSIFAGSTTMELPELV